VILESFGRARFTSGSCRNRRRGLRAGARWDVPEALLNGSGGVGRETGGAEGEQDVGRELRPAHRPPNVPQHATRKIPSAVPSARRRVHRPVFSNASKGVPGFEDLTGLLRRQFESTRSPRKPLVLMARRRCHRHPDATDIQAFQLRFFHRKKQMVKPASGGARTARMATTHRDRENGPVRCRPQHERDHHRGEYQGRDRTLPPSRRSSGRKPPGSRHEGDQRAEVEHFRAQA